MLNLLVQHFWRRQLGVVLLDVFFIVIENMNSQA